MKKTSAFLLRVLLCLCLSLVLLPAARANAATLTQLQEKFPSGAYWNHVAGNGHYYSNYSDVGSCNNPDGCSWTPCYSHSANAPTGYYDCNSFNGGMQCCGFARKLAFDAYGSYATNWTNYTYDTANSYMWSSLKPGDVLHYTGGNADAEYGHWVFVTAVNGTAITVGECNIYNGPCQIRWGNVIYKDQIYAQRVCVAPYELPIIRPEALEYIGKCTKYPTYGTAMVAKSGANINDRPCSKETDAGIITLIDGTVGVKYIVTAVYKNTEGNYWFEVKTDLGQPGYIYSGNCIYQPEFDDVVCSGSIPESVAMDGTLTLSGTITAPSTKIQKATVTLYTENGQEYMSQAKNAVDGAIDLSGFSFQLRASAPMKLTCKVAVNVAHYNIDTEKYPTGTVRSYDIGTVNLTCVNHTYGNWTLTKYGTCTVDGEWTRTCSICGSQETKPDTAPGHNWTVANSSGVTCTNPGYTNYACLTCGEWTAEEGQVSWSDWTADYPDTSLDRIETKTQYRYRDRGSSGQSSQTGYVDYVKSWPNGFDPSNSYRTTYTQTPKTAYETDTERLVIESDNVVGYLYWHWCRGRYLEQPYNSIISDGYTDTYWCFHAYYSTTYVPFNSSANACNASNYSCCQDTYWFFQLPVYRQSYRIEAKTDANGQWGSWSEWSDNAVTASSTREVETRNLYRYISSGLANHSWGTPVRTKEPTNTSDGELTYTCTVCSNQKIEILPKLNFRECSHDQTALYGKVDATCTTEGYSGDLICSACGETVAAGTTVAVLGHTEVTVPGKAATCTQPGLTEGKHCSVCDTVITAQEIIIEKGHAEVTVVGKAATCAADGLSDGKKCSVCGMVTLEQETIPAKPHTYDDNVDGTCNACSVSRETVETRQVTHMFRMYNPNTGEHFYTGSEVEKSNLVVAGWQYEGVGFTFPANTGAPVHRLFQPSTGEHLYTMDEAEKDELMAEGWNYEGIAFNSAYNTEAVQHRLHNPNATVGAYHFTFSLEEKQNLIDAGWEYQGIGWYSCWK